MSDKYSTYDAAYLIGALSPEDRRDYEQHLIGCPDCRTALGQISGVPGLLTRMPDIDTLTSDDVPPVPESLLPRLLDAVERRRRRRRWLAAVGGIAAAACLALALVVGLGPQPPAAQLAATPTSSAISAASGPLTASAQLTERAWGTQIKLQCMYSGAAAYPLGPYRLVIIDPSGSNQQIATWNVVPDKEAVVEASTSLTSDQISTLEVRTASNIVVLTLTP
ncbi:putative zinc finger protein [Antricoccus suffuscus]|uniref:Putative zinc finger protein n=1 Tax=Antricoccus suffuscus TaxID=1629062 RepID=A0A2T0ZW69_9ACTN|nr:zf-HC2 domain-containing protein [Antricoccus suffuscus]PRZ40534.1 putative zinc finger protein [Antricoccus suffuscus]